MKAPPFAYARAESLDDALALLAEAGDDAKLLAGGQSLVPLLAYRLASARPTSSTSAALTGSPAPSPGDACSRSVRSSVTRTRRGPAPRRGAPAGGGRPAHRAPADPRRAARSAAASRTRILRRSCRSPLLALDAPSSSARRPASASPERRSSSSARSRPRSPPDEPCRGRAFLPAPRRSVGAFAEFAVRAGDFALAAAARLARSTKPRARIRIALGGVDATPLRAPRAERALEGAEPTDEAIAAAAAAAAAVRPVEDATTRAATGGARGVLVRDALVRVADEAAA